MFKSYQYLFFKNELKTLLGNKGLNFFRLFLILFLTLFALAFAEGSNKYLKKKMSNPFTNWVTVAIDVNYITDKNKKDLIEFFNSKKNLKSFNLKDYFGFVINTEQLKNRKGKPISIRGRTVSPENSLVKSLLSLKNVYYVNLKDTTNGLYENWPSQNYYDLIVNESFINKMGYTLEDSLLKVNLNSSSMAISDSNMVDIDIWLNIFAVVKNLPNDCDFIYTPNLYNASFYNKLGFNPNNEIGVKYSEFISKSKGNIFRVLSKEKDKTVFLENLKNDIDSLKQFLAADRHQEQRQFKVSKNDFLYEYKIVFNHSKRLYNYEFKEIFNRLKEERNNYYHNHLVKFDTNHKVEITHKPYYYAFNFKELNKIRPFKNLLKKKFGAKVEMSKVESAENFSFVSALTKALSIILLILGLCVVIIYLINLLKNHIERIAVNLGTIKAFGLSNSSLISIYLLEVTVLLGTGIAMVYLCIFLLNKFNIVGYFLMLFVSGIDMASFDINLSNNWIYLAITIIILLSLFTAFYSLKLLLGRTPGDLIYNRN